MRVLTRAAGKDLPLPPLLRGRGDGGEGVEPATISRFLEGSCVPLLRPSPPGVPGGDGVRGPATRLSNRQFGSAKCSRWHGEPDVQLMLRVQRDEAGALGELIRLYWPRLFGLFFKQFRDRQEAEDLAQDVFLRLYRNRRRYQPRASFATWLFHIARNVARNAVRGRRRRPIASLSTRMAAAGDDWMPVNRPEAPTRSMEREETRRAVRQAMAGLARRQRTALELQFQDWSYSEIAAELEMTPKAAKSLLYRARLQLRQSLDPFMAAEAS
jgi:RNA polymerase sigma-70 factor (ECF subfamily)